MEWPGEKQRKKIDEKKLQIQSRTQRKRKLECEGEREREMSKREWEDARVASNIWGVTVPKSLHTTFYPQIFILSLNRACFSEDKKHEWARERRENIWLILCLSREKKNGREREREKEGSSGLQGSGMVTIFHNCFTFILLSYLQSRGISIITKTTNLTLNQQNVNFMYITSMWKLSI